MLIRLLSGFQIEAEFFVDPLELLDECLSGRVDTVVRLSYPDRMAGVISVVSEEGRHSGRRVLGIVVHELRQRQQLTPVILMVVTIDTQVLF